MAQKKQPPARLSWENLADPEMGGAVWRSKVPGGWLVYVYNYSDFSDENVGSWGHGGLTFYPDPKHEWNGGSE